MAYLYNYVGQPWKTQQRVRQIMDSFYLPSPDGLIGNEDCADAAWYVWARLVFTRLRRAHCSTRSARRYFPSYVSSRKRKSFVVKARGVSHQNIYIQSATFNGRAYHHSYLLHKDLMNGGELVFQMGPQPNQAWGSGPGDIPKSFISGQRLGSAFN